MKPMEQAIAIDGIGCQAQSTLWISYFLLMQLLDPICSEGRRQAPIDINRCCPVKMPTLNWIDYEDRPEGYEMVNSGQTGIFFNAWPNIHI